LFAPVLPEAFDERWLPGLRALMSRLGRLRDLDVLQAEILAPVRRALADEPRLIALAGRIAEQRNTARRDVLETLHGADYRLFVLALMGALQQAPFVITATVAAAGDELGQVADSLTFVRFATKRVHRLHAKVIAMARLAQRDDPGSLHRLRIGIKRLRYGLEFFAPLMAVKPLRHAVQRLATLQDDLGQLNDLASAGVSLMHCAGTESALREAVALVGGWHGVRHGELLDVVESLVANVPQIRLPKFAAWQPAVDKPV
jgi:adenylate cyclase